MHAKLLFYLHKFHVLSRAQVTLNIRDRKKTAIMTTNQIESLNRYIRKTKQKKESNTLNTAWHMGKSQIHNMIHVQFCKLFLCKHAHCHHDRVFLFDLLLLFTLFSFICSFDFTFSILRCSFERMVLWYVCFVHVQMRVLMNIE